MPWTAKEFVEAIQRQGFPDKEILFVDSHGHPVPFRWLYGELDGLADIQNVIVRFDVEL